MSVANGFLAGCIVIGLLALIMMCMICCGYKSLKVAIDVVDAASDFIKKTKRIIAVPVVYFFVQLIFVLVWFFSMICIWSIGNIEPNTNTLENPYHQIKEVTFAKDAKTGKSTAPDMYWLAIGMFFGLLWIIAFLKAQSTFIVMSSAATYYFDSNA